MNKVDISNIEIKKLDPPKIEKQKNKNGREYKKTYNFAVTLHYPAGCGETKTAVCTTIRRCFEFALRNREPAKGTNVN